MKQRITASRRQSRVLSSSQTTPARGVPGHRALLRRSVVRVVSGVAFVGIVVAALMGGLGGGGSVAGASDIPRQCLEYQAALKRCYGPTAERMRMPWQGSAKHLDPMGLGQQCAAETERLNGACR